MFASFRHWTDYLGFLLAALVSTGAAMVFGFGTAFIKDAARREAWSQLDDYVDAVGKKLVRLQDAPGPQNSPPVELILHDVAAGAPYRAVFVDNQWQVRAGDAAAPQGSNLNWSTSPSAPAQNTAGVGPLCFHGILQTPEGPALAAAAPAPGLNGYIVAYRSVDQLSINPLSATLPLLCACLIAFIGTMSLFGLGGYLILARIHERFSQRWAELQTVALRRAEGLVRSRDAIVFGLADLTESRDPETGNHLQRLAMYASTLTLSLRHRDKFRDVVTHEFVDVLRQSALLHDIGKVAVEDAILLKPGPLTPQERQQMQQHATVGEHCLRRIEQQLGPTKFIHTAREIAHSHHERWDGRGYPQGLSGERIPLSARIVAVCDVYDALSCRRVYKEAWPHEECVAYIRQEAGKHFDPDIVEAFLQIHENFKTIALQYATAESRDSIGRNNAATRRSGRDDEKPRIGGFAPGSPSNSAGHVSM